MKAIRVAKVEEIAEHTGKTFEVEGKRIALFRVGDHFYALDDTCSHAEASLGEGEVDADELTIECPRHGATFDLKTGRARTLPAHVPVSSYPVWVEEGMVIVEMD